MENQSPAYLLGRRHAEYWAEGQYRYIMTARRAALRLTNTSAEWLDANRGFNERIRSMDCEYFDDLNAKRLRARDA